jgi:hypothetical protein
MKGFAKIYEVPLGAFIMIDGKPVKCKSRCKIGDRVYFNGEEIYALDAVAEWYLLPQNLSSKVVSILPSKTSDGIDVLIVITVIQSVHDDEYFWFICDQRREILSDNTKSCGYDTANEAIAAAQNTVANFI